MSRAAPHSREARLDALKGIAVVCVVTYHALGQYFTYTPATGTVYFTWALCARAFLFSFMLPLFAFLSGYVLGRPNGFRPREYFRKRTLGLLVPYLMWESLYGPSKHPEMLSGLREFWGYYVGALSNPHYEGRMWYLLVLWLALMVVGMVRLLGDRAWLIALSVPFVWWIATMTPYWWLRWLYVFVCAGLLFRRYEVHVLPHLPRLGIAGALAFGPLWVAVLPEPVAAERFARLAESPQAQAFARAALVYVPLAVGACAVAALFAVSYHLPCWLESGLAYLGTLSLGIYVVHFPFVEMWHDMPWWFLPVNVLIATVVAVGWTLVLGRIRLTATLLLGEPWVRKARELGDVQTETL